MLIKGMLKYSRPPKTNQLCFPKNVVAFGVIVSLKEGLDLIQGPPTPGNKCPSLKIEV
jgi:hypothetical protein